MAKQATNAKSKTPEPPPKAKEEKHLPVKQDAAAGGPPAELFEAMEEAAEKGVSKLAEDNIVPLIYILQPLSPVVNPRKPEHIEGAEPGMIWLRNAPTPLVDGETGILFQPCYSYKMYVEWQPNRGGFVASHNEMPAEAEERPDPQDAKKKIWTMPKTGNIIVETRYRAGYVVSEDRKSAVPYVIPFSSSGHTVARQWMFLMNQKLLKSGKTAASFSCLYRLKLKERTNPKGSWFVFDISDAGWVQTAEEFKRGHDLYNAFASGAKVAEELTGNDDDADEDNDDKAM